jgi:diguanylate cyclase (GGDEF)-like protein/PAS domain S-box-containing protein
LSGDLWITAVNSPHSAERQALAEEWAQLIATWGETGEQSAARFRRWVDVLAGAVCGDPFGTAQVSAAGREMAVAYRETGDWLPDTVELVGRGLLGLSELRDRNDFAKRIVLAMGALMSGYRSAVAEAVAEDITDTTDTEGKRQEGFAETAVEVAREAHRGQLVCAARFDQVFTHTTNGVALTGLDGHFLRTNTALSTMLERHPGELTGLTLFDVIAPGDVDEFRAEYAELLDGTVGQLRQEHQLVRKTGEAMWGRFVGSLVRDADGQGRQVVLVVEDDTEVSLLQRRLSHQSLHDPVTGLPNRQYFTSRLETALRQAPATTGITLFQLDLDGFSTVTDGFGYALGDRFLSTVAERLTETFGGENALLARLGADDFGVLMENTTATPDVPTMINRIQEALAEPAYLDHRHGLATTASIGVVHRPTPSTAPEEALRAMHTALRHARQHGRGHWELFHPAEHAHLRHAAYLAAAMPGAWEHGQLRVAYQPLIDLGSEQIAGLEAVLRWDHPELGVLPHAMCVNLAGKTGLHLRLNPWLVHTACAQIRRNHGLPGRELPLVTGLTPHQAADPHLAGTIRQVLRDTELAPTRLRPSLPVSTLLEPETEAAHNLKRLADLGTRPVVHDVGATTELAGLPGLPIHAIRLARPLTTGHPDAGDGSLLTRTLTDLVDTAHLRSAVVIVEGIDTRPQATRWQQLGADFATGELYPLIPPASSNPHR